MKTYNNTFLFRYTITEDRFYGIEERSDKTILNDWRYKWKRENAFKRKWVINLGYKEKGIQMT